MTGRRGLAGPDHGLGLAVWSWLLQSEELLMSKIDNNRPTSTSYLKELGEGLLGNAVGQSLRVVVHLG